MDTITVDGKMYMKATKAADDVGYTSDYIGQLCRKGALVGMMLGKTWYVTEESLLLHKQSQQRANIGTTRRDIQEQKKLLYKKQNAVPYTRFSIQNERRNYVSDSDIRYSQDTAELLPMVTISAPINEMKLPELDTIPPDREETIVPIHHRVEIPDIQTITRTIPERTIQFSDKTRHKNPVLFRSLLSVICVLLLIFVAVSVAVESTLIYTQDNSQKAQLETTYQLTSVSAVIKAVREVKF